MIKAWIYTVTQQEPVIEASQWVTWVLSKNKKPSKKIYEIMNVCKWRTFKDEIISKINQHRYHCYKTELLKMVWIEPRCVFSRRRRGKQPDRIHLRKDVSVNFQFKLKHCVTVYFGFCFSRCELLHWKKGTRCQPILRTGYIKILRFSIKCKLNLVTQY